MKWNRIENINSQLIESNNKTTIYYRREERDIEPKAFANLVSSVLYERRWGPFFVEPVVVGLEGPKVKFH